MSADLPGMGGDFAKTGASGAGNVYDTSPTGLGLSPAYLAPGAVASASSTSGSTPSGTILAFGGAAAPAGYVLCDGAAYDGTTATYMNLWSVLGTTYGGTGQSSFKVPDLRGRVIAGYAASGGHTDVSTLGNNDGVSAANRRPKHRHTVGIVASATANASPGGTGSYRVDTVGTPGSGNSNDSLDAPAYLVLNYVIAL